jgi:hypothetical protein
MQMIDVELPTTDDRVVVLSRYTEPASTVEAPTSRSAAAENHCPEQPRRRVSAHPL